LPGELGKDLGGNLLKLATFNSDDRVGVIHQVLGEPGLIGDSFIVSFVATPDASSPINPATGLPLLFPYQNTEGLWTVRVDVEQDPAVAGKLIFRPTNLQLVAQIGEKIQGEVVSSIAVYDPLAHVKSIGGTPRTERQGDHQVAFVINGD